MITYSESDIDRDLAIRAYNGTSWSPEKRADSTIGEYMHDMATAVEEFSRYATDENREVIAASLEAYRQGYIQRLNAYLSAHSGVMSTMIAGPSKFPTNANAKRSDTADRRRDEWLTWSREKLEKMRQMYDPRRLAKAPILSTDDDAIEKLQAKIADAEQMQEMMKSANKVVRSAKLTDEEKRAKLRDLGFGEKLVHEFMTPDYMGKLGVPSYMLTNNSANIRRMKARVEEIEKERQRPPSSDDAIAPGVTVTENEVIGRLQVIFDDKPSRDVCQWMRRNGFVWSPTNGAWQRQLNQNARAAVKSLAPRLRELMGVGETAV